MHPCLLKKLLPFALTFIIGATIGGLLKSRVTTRTLTERNTLMLDHSGYGYSHSCRMHSRNLVAETKPLLILFKPDAALTRVAGRMANGKGLSDGLEEQRESVWVRVTFGADGKVQDVQQLQPLLPATMLDAVKHAAQQIQFTPETVNSVPITVTKDIEIHFMGD